MSPYIRNRALFVIAACIKSLFSSLMLKNSAFHFDLFFLQRTLSLNYINSPVAMISPGKITNLSPTTIQQYRSSKRNQSLQTMTHEGLNKAVLTESYVTNEA